MKILYRINLLIVFLVFIFSADLRAQRIIKGTISSDGEPAAGAIVEVHRGETIRTGFEGNYEIEAWNNSKWVKFTYKNESVKVNISDITKDVFDFAFDRRMPSDENDSEVNDLVLKAHDELIKDKDQEYLNEYSLYQEFYKLNYFELALPHWKNIFTKYPKSSPNIYIHGIKIYESLIGNIQNTEERESYIDELMRIYDKRITYFNEKGYVLGRKATNWLNYKLNTGDTPEGDDLKETLLQGYEWLKISVTEQEDNIELHVYGLFMQTTRSLFLLGELSEEEVVNNYTTSINKINLILQDSEDEAITQQAREIKNHIDEIYGSSGAADCASLINIFSQQLDDKSSDIEFIKNMLRLLRNARCDENDLFSKASEKLYEFEPSAEAAFNMARRFVKNNDSDRAKKYYQQAIKLETNNDLLANYYYEYALFIYLDEDAFLESRSYARKALELNPDFCQALMLIGDIYVSASRNYALDDFEKATVFWLAVDYFELARRAGYDCSVEAAEKVSTYMKYFPDKEEIFFRSLQVGQSYKLEGWINESTSVRIKRD